MFLSWVKNQTDRDSNTQILQTKSQSTESPDNVSAWFSHPSTQKMHYHKRKKINTISERKKKNITQVARPGILLQKNGSQGKLRGGVTGDTKGWFLKVAELSPSPSWQCTISGGILLFYLFICFHCLTAWFSLQVVQLGLSVAEN